MTEPVPVHNGRAAGASWKCGGYLFKRVVEYESRIERLPRLAGVRFGASYPARRGAHVVTFEATPVGREAERASPWLRGGNALHDVLTLWSFAQAIPVLVPPIKRPPASGDLGYELADDGEMATTVTTAYRECRLRPRRRRVWSALLTYLELAQQRQLQVDAVLLTSVLECLAPLPRRAAATRYQPIVTHLAAVPVVAAAALDRSKIEMLVVELYKLRNGFLHSGVHPYRDNIDLGGVTVTTGRVVRGTRVLAKLAIANALGFSITCGANRLADEVKYLFDGGSFVPRDVAALIAAHAAASGGT
jgi:hypothetical protein